MSGPASKKLKTTGKEATTAPPDDPPSTTEQVKDKRKPLRWTIEERSPYPDFQSLPDPNPCFQRQRVEYGHPFPFRYEKGYDELPQALRRAVCDGNLEYVKKVFDNPRLTSIALRGSRNSALRTHPVGVDPQPPYFATAPDPGSIRVSHSTDWSLDVPLITHACDHGHADIVQYFIEKGANINVFTDKRHYVDTDSKGKGAATPLSVACKNGFEDIARLLIEKGAILMPMEWKIIRRRSRDSFYGKDITVNHTPIDWVVSNRMHSLLETMIEHGLLNASSAQFQDRRSLSIKQQKYASELVGHSILCKLLRIWLTMVYSRPPLPDEEYRSYLKMFEMLGQASFIVAGFMEKIEEEELTRKHETRRRSHFDANGRPADHTVAIIRGMRHVDLGVMRFLGYKDPESVIPRLIDPSFKQSHWRETVEYSQRVPADGSHAWRKPIRDIIILASEPWSRRNHHLFPSAVREYARELIRFGALLERRVRTASTSKVSLSKIYEDNVIPFVVG